MKNLFLCTTAVLAIGTASAFAQQVTPIDRPESIGESRVEDACVLCFPGRPRPGCASYFVTENLVLYRLSGDVAVNPDIGMAHGWEAGWLINVSKRSAVGVTGLLMWDQIRMGIKARYRRWLSDRFAVDAGLGKLMVEETGSWGGWVGSLGLSWRDRLHFTLQYENGEYEDVRYLGPWPGGIEWGKKRASSLYAGLKVGGEIGAVTMVVEAALLAIVLASWD